MISKNKYKENKKKYRNLVGGTDHKYKLIVNFSNVKQQEKHIDTIKKFVIRLILKMIIK